MVLTKDLEYKRLDFVLKSLPVCIFSVNLQNESPKILSKNTQHTLVPSASNHFNDFYAIILIPV